VFRSGELFPKIKSNGFGLNCGEAGIELSIISCVASSLNVEIES
jgi:hypothetical protein